MKAILSYLSQLGHLVKFSSESPKTRLEKGMIVISVDIDVGNKQIGIVNKGKNDENVNRCFSEYSIGVIEELALPMFLGFFEEFEFPVTFAIRGQWLEFPNDTLDCLLESSIKHDIGAHGYYHRRFRYLSQEEANYELAKIHTVMNRSNLAPTSFVFPGNSVAHLDLLAKYGFKCYRGHGSFLSDDMYIRRQSQLWDVHPSLYVDQWSKFPIAKKILDLCSSRKLPFHMWFHLWNFGETKDSIQKILRNLLRPLLRYAKLQARDARLDFETMASAIQNMEVEV